MYRRILELINRPDPNDPLRLAGMGMRCTFSELINDPHDFNVANGFFSLIVGAQNGEFDARFYRAVERPIVLTWHANGIIGNGGFAYIFEGEWRGDPDFKLTIEAHRTIGCQDQVRAFELALSAVSDNTVMSNRRDAFISLPGETQNEINALYWSGRGTAKEIGTIEKQIAKYVRENRKKLGYLRGRIS